MNSGLKIHFFFVIIAGLVFNSCSSQNTQQDQVSNRKSPIAIASIKHNSAYIKVVYGQPYKQERTIFGELEPFGEVWRTGANEATEITVTEPVFFGDQAIEAGTYALFTIPEEDTWTIILNSELGQWGAFNYDESRDYLRFEAPVIDLDSPVEAFTIEFSDVNLSLTTMSLAWDDTKVEIPVRFY